MSSLRQIEELLREVKVSHSEIRLRNDRIADELMMTSAAMSNPNFKQFHAADLRMLFELYDTEYFENLLARTVAEDDISFRISRRMTKAGGKTTQWKRPLSKSAQYEIAVSATLLFQSFNDPGRTVNVTGVSCRSRLDGLMRIMEHEIVHLAELVVWNESRCSLHRFQDIASRFFSHTDHRHQLMTPTEAAVVNYGIKPGQIVGFDFRGRRLKGMVNRVTRRATVLVRHPAGEQYSDGNRYLKYYIPLHHLEPLG